MSVVDVDDYLPQILRSQSLQARVSNEIKQHHRWFAVVFHYSDQFSRLFRVISIATNALIMLFMQSLTYNFTSPDDGSCKGMTTQRDCLLPLSPYATGEPKCRWTNDQSSTDHGTCSFIEPDSSINIILFVAIFSAIVSTPLAVLCDFVIQYILSASTDSVKNAVQREKSKSILELFLRRPKVGDSSKSLNLTALNEMNSLSSDIQVYREELNDAERREFDSKMIYLYMIILYSNSDLGTGCKWKIHI